VIKKLHSKLTTIQFTLVYINN